MKFFTQCSTIETMTDSMQPQALLSLRDSSSPLFPDFTIQIHPSEVPKL